ncbi:ATP-binding protein [Crossiella cryophila]|uniref:Tetratricopeptide (TPR) repeat protein/transcriptional regulator with XRE-family HTH domain n=1 Tax=Crossiella cryophila TaxID=43355 RepID=A0A7W7FWL6_9PSEU|nr:tetratricopeptide repeat protein [Crossiella cryophila]MBB4680180.1 tetratricopeptide (TPR) repeat protein/transcriptional regulator with XRE-family HTH domain [Crossiella cryophila]
MIGRFGLALRQARTLAGLTQEQLADRSGVGVRTIGGLETGSRGDPRPSTARRLADALGLDPQARGRLLAAAVDDPVSLAGRDDLPGDLADFTGRSAEIDRLLAVGDGRAVVIEAIDGMAGVGKTTLAVHLAHRLADRYPDGRLFLDLHGHASAEQATDPAVALEVLLRALGVPGDRIPAGLAERSALWRAELAERKVLVLLDNAASATQIRPLLPGSPDCLALVTSRGSLADLDGAQVLSLDVLPEAEAIALFAGIAGAERVAGQRESVAELVRLCGLLPLAIRIAAARLRSRPVWTVAHLAGRLRDGLTELSTGDRGVAAAFSLSYQHLTPEQQRLFRLLGLHPGPDIDPHAAAALACRASHATERLLEDLVDAHLLQQHVSGRYRFHDLVRSYAATAAATDPDRAAALTRLVEHYLHTAHAADRLLEPHREPFPLEPATTGRPPTDPAAWFDAEQANLAAIHHLASAQGRHTQVWQLACALDVFHRRRGRLHGALTVWEAGLTAAEALDEPAARSRAHRLLGHAHARLGRHEQAVRHLHQALELAEHTGDLLAQAHTQHTLAWASERQGNNQLALDHATEALHLYQKLALTRREAQALNAVGWYHALLGEYEQARAHCETALTLHRGHQDGAATLDALGYTLDSLGYIAHHTGRHTDARDYYQQALTVFRDLGNTYEEANTLAKLAAAQHSLGAPEQAGDCWRQALRLYRQQGRRPDADRIRHHLAALAK